MTVRLPITPAIAQAALKIPYRLEPYTGETPQFVATPAERLGRGGWVDVHSGVSNIVAAAVRTAAVIDHTPESSEALHKAALAYAPSQLRRYGRILLQQHNAERVGPDGGSFAGGRTGHFRFIPFGEVSESVPTYSRETLIAYLRTANYFGTRSTLARLREGYAEELEVPHDVLAFLAIYPPAPDKTAADRIRRDIQQEFGVGEVRVVQAVLEAGVKPRARRVPGEYYQEADCYLPEDVEAIATVLGKERATRIIAAPVSSALLSPDLSVSPPPPGAAPVPNQERPAAEHPDARPPVIKLGDLAKVMRVPINVVSNALFKAVDNPGIHLPRRLNTESSRMAALSGHQIVGDDIAAVGREIMHMQRQTQSYRAYDIQQVAVIAGKRLAAVVDHLRATGRVVEGQNMANVHFVGPKLDALIAELDLV